MKTSTTLFLISVLISSVLVSCQTSPVSNDDLNLIALKGATIFDGAGNRIDDGTILVEDGRITAIGSEVDIPPSSDVIDVSGKFITPGLVDAHVHYFQTGFFDSRPDAQDLRDTIPYEVVYEDQKNNSSRYHRTYLASGVTAVYDVGGFIWSVEMALEAEKNLYAPHMSAAGPLITPFPDEFISIFQTSNDTVMYHLGSESLGRRVVRTNSQAGSTGIKIWGVDESDKEFLNNLLAVADEAERQSNSIIAHATRLESAKAALDVGARLLVHSVTDVGVDEEFIRLLLDREAIYNPTLVVSRGYLKARKGILEGELTLNDPNNVVDDQTKMLVSQIGSFRKFVDTAALSVRIERFEEFLDREDSIMSLNLRRVFEAGAKIAVGTDAGNPGTFHGISIYDEMEAMQAAGIPADQLIIMATRNGAEAMQRLSDFGTLEVGKMADLIILEKDPSFDIVNFRTIEQVMRGGQIRSVNELRERR